MPSGVSEKLLQCLMNNGQLHLEPQTSTCKYQHVQSPARWAHLWQLITPFYGDTDHRTSF